MTGTIPVETDLSLLQRFAKSGDHAVFAEIVRRYAAMVFATCHRVLHDSARAEDAAQETFFRLMRRPEVVSQSLAAWLHTAATNLAVDALRSESARRRREREYAAEACAERANSAGEISQWAELSPKIDEAMAQLAEDDRLLLIAHFLQGRPQNELAVEHHVSTATMSRRIRAAAEGLQHKLHGYGLSITPLALIGLLHDNAMHAVPVKLAAELGKMTLMSGVKNLLGPGAASGNSSLGWTIAAILLISIAAGAITDLMGDRIASISRSPVTRINFTTPR